MFSTDHYTLITNKPIEITDDNMVIVSSYYVTGFQGRRPRKNEKLYITGGFSSREFKCVLADYLHWDYKNNEWVSIELCDCDDMEAILLEPEAGQKLSSIEKERFIVVSDIPEENGIWLGLGNKPAIENFSLTSFRAVADSYSALLTQHGSESGFEYDKLSLSLIVKFLVLNSKYILMGFDGHGDPIEAEDYYGTPCYVVFTDYEHKLPGIDVEMENLAGLISAADQDGFGIVINPDESMNPSIALSNDSVKWFKSKQTKFFAVMKNNNTDELIEFLYS